MSPVNAAPAWLAPHEWRLPTCRRALQRDRATTAFEFAVTSVNRLMASSGLLYDLI